jgi:hypothetical protein
MLLAVNAGGDGTGTGNERAVSPHTPAGAMER